MVQEHQNIMHAMESDKSKKVKVNDVSNISEHFQDKKIIFI